MNFAEVTPTDIKIADVVQRIGRGVRERRLCSSHLRSKTPDLVQQEPWGLLPAPFAVRQLMTQPAWARQLDPDRLSFTHAVRVIKRKMPQTAGAPTRAGSSAR